MGISLFFSGVLLKMDSLSELVLAPASLAFDGRLLRSASKWVEHLARQRIGHRLVDTECLRRLVLRKMKGTEDPIHAGQDKRVVLVVDPRMIVRVVPVMKCRRGNQPL